MLKRTARAHPAAVHPAIHCRDLVSMPKYRNVVDLNYPIPALNSAIIMDDDITDDYIDELQGVTTLGINRGLPQVQRMPWHCSMDKAIVPCPQDKDLIQPSKNLESWATERPGASNVKMEPGHDVGKATDHIELDVEIKVVQETPLSLFEKLREVVVAQKLEYANIAIAFEEDMEQKERLITTLQNEIRALKVKLLTRRQGGSRKRRRDLTILHNVIRR